jgi:tocopherol cyclase
MTELFETKFVIIKIYHMMSFRFLKPEIFQGNLKKKNYFEGWYFKHVSSDIEHVYSFIPGVSLNPRDPHAFIQVINGITGETDYVSYPLDRFLWDKNSLYLKIGDSIFTDKYIDLNIKSVNLDVTGHIEYNNITKYQRTLISPGIMGWYSFVPYMECKHGIVSVNHDLNGNISINGHSIDFTNGKGYIEKDWGTSFPEAWIWIQSNNFSSRGTSFSFSIAKIPWLGRFFMGFIAFLYLEGRYILFSTYNNSVISNILHNKESVSLTLKNKTNILKVNVVKNNFGELMAPASGDMSRRIKESIDSTVDLTLYDKNGNLIYEDSGRRAGLEVIEEIFDYI